MKDNTQEKNLIERNESNVFGKIKNFFRKLFRKKQESIEDKKVKISEEEIEKSDIFKDYIRKIDNEETELFDLQRRYRKGEIADKDLTQEQIDSLCLLYDKQIVELKRSIEVKEQQLSKYRKKNTRSIKENNA